MSNLQTKLQEFKAVWATKPERSLWPADLEPQADLYRESGRPPLGFGFFLNADDTPRFGASLQPWPEPIAAVVYRPLPAFRLLEVDEEQSWAA